MNTTPTYNEWLPSTPHTDPRAKISRYRTVRGVTVARISGASYRNAVLSGVFELTNQSGDDPVRKLPGGKSKVEVICAWYGCKSNLHFDVSDPGSLVEVIKDYSGEVVDNISRDFLGKATNDAATPDALEDIESDAALRELTETERRAEIDARRGQGKYRKDLIEVWGGCAVTRCTHLGILRASHIKPWRDSSHAERLNRFNGLLLSPNLDAAFDRGLISFADDGTINISTLLSTESRLQLGIGEGLRLVYVYPENCPFLDYHRKKYGF